MFLCLVTQKSHVWLFMSPWTVACQVPQSMEFSRQEYWSGQLCPPPGDLSNSGIEPRSPTLQEDSSMSELPGKPKNTGEGSLSLLQGIFPTQGLNLLLLHCRWILYHLSHPGSPNLFITFIKVSWGWYYFFCISDTSCFLKWN